ncbi:hypothetical protein [Kitasatospora sp. GP82]|nr:hypothetical protein [Kitasatospora sp. GP82]
MPPGPDSPFLGRFPALEREVTERRGEPATTDDCLTAIAETRPTLNSP